MENECAGGLMDCAVVEGNCATCHANPNSLAGKLKSRGITVGLLHDHVEDNVPPAGHDLVREQRLQIERLQEKIEKLTTVALYYVKENGYENPPVYLARDLNGEYAHIKSVVDHKSVDWDMEVLEE